MEDKDSKNICGIDIGNKNIVMTYFNSSLSVSKIIENSHEDGRCFGILSEEYVFFLDIFLGKKIADYLEELETSFYFPDYKSLFDKDVDSNILFKTNYDKYSMQQYILMMLYFLKKDIELSNNSIGKYVISVPPNFKTPQYTELKELFGLSDIYNIEIIPTYVGTALTYGYENNQNIKKGDEKRLLFIDIGYIGTSVTIVEYYKDECKILSNEYDENIGGRTIDKYLIDKFQEQIKNEYKIDIYNNKQNYVKVRNSLIKAKEKLSADGADEVAVTFDGILDDKEDYETSLSVNDIKKLIVNFDFSDKLIKVIDEAINKSKLSKKHIKELIPTPIGGTMRITCLKDTVKEHLKKYDITTDYNLTLNMDENVSYGCSYKGAIDIGKWKYTIKELPIENDPKYKVKPDSYYTEIKAIELELEKKDEILHDIANEKNNLESKCYKYLASIDDEIAEWNRDKIRNFINDNTLNYIKANPTFVITMEKLKELNKELDEEYEKAKTAPKPPTPSPVKENDKTVDVIQKPESEPKPEVKPESETKPKPELPAKSDVKPVTSETNRNRNVLDTPNDSPKVSVPILIPTTAPNVQTNEQKLEKVQKEFNRLSEKYNKCLNNHKGIVIYSTIFNEFNQLKTKYEAAKSNIGLVSDCIEDLKNKYENFQILNIINNNCNELINNNIEIVPNNYKEAINSAHESVIPYVKGEIQENEYKEKFEQFKEINENLKELNYKIVKFIQYEDNAKLAEKLFNELKQLVDDYEILLRENVDYVKRDESLNFINDVKSRISDIFMNTADCKLQIEPSKELVKKMREELSKLKYNLDSKNINNEIMSNFKLIQLKLTEYGQLLAETNKLDDYYYFYEHYVSVQDEMNKLTAEQRIRHIHHQYQRILIAFDIMIPKLKSAIDDYYIHLRDRKLEIINPLLKRMNYKTQLLGNNCSNFKIFLEQTESHLQNRNLTESSYDNIIDSIQKNTKSIDEYFYKSSIRVTTYSSYTEQIQSMRKLLCEMIQKFQYPNPIQNVNYKLTESSRIINDSTELSQFEHNPLESAKVILRLQDYIRKLKQIYEAESLSKEEQIKKIRDQEEVSKLKDTYDQLILVLEQVIKSAISNNPKQKKEYKEYLKSIKTWSYKTHSISSYNREIKSLNEYLIKLKAKTEKFSKPVEYYNLSNKIFRTNNSRFVNCKCIRVYGNNNIICECSESIIEGNYNLINSSYNCNIINNNNTIKMSGVLKVYGHCNNIEQSNKITLIGNKNTVSKSIDITLQGDFNFIKNTRKVDVVGTSTQNQVIKCLNVDIMGPRNLVAESEDVIVKGDRNQIINNKSVNIFGKTNECKKNQEILYSHHTGNIC